jgi:hypothetical protein
LYAIVGVCRAGRRVNTLKRSLGPRPGGAASLCRGGFGGGQRATVWTATRLRMDTAIAGVPRVC